MNPFPPELRTAAIIPRWSVVWTLNKDTVSNHSFYVTMYAYHIAKLIRWNGDMSVLMYAALVHDLDEVVTGDIVSPVKRAIIDEKISGPYILDKMTERMPIIMKELDTVYERNKGSSKDEEINAIVKAADRLDALLFLVIEQRMGNRHVFARCGDALERLEEAWMKLPFSYQMGETSQMGETRLSALWADVVLPSIKAHGQYGGSGV